MCYTSIKTRIPAVELDLPCKFGCVTPGASEIRRIVVLDLPCNFGCDTPDLIYDAAKFELDLPCKFGCVTPHAHAFDSLLSWICLAILGVIHRIFGNCQDVKELQAFRSEKSIGL